MPTGDEREERVRELEASTREWEAFGCLEMKIRMADAVLLFGTIAALRRQVEMLEAEQGDLLRTLEPLRAKIAELAQERDELVPTARLWCQLHEAAESVANNKTCTPTCPYPKIKAVLDSLTTQPH